VLQTLLGCYCMAKHHKSVSQISGGLVYKQFSVHGISTHIHGVPQSYWLKGQKLS
jgi:hypothetical protein